MPRWKNLREAVVVAAAAGERRDPVRPSCVLAQEQWEALEAALSVAPHGSEGNGSWGAKKAEAERSLTSSSSHGAICMQHAHMALFPSSFPKFGAITQACQLTSQAFSSWKLLCLELVQGPGLEKL